MKYAVFIPCYNAENTILETLSYLEKSIIHYNKPIDVFIYNDCSKDNSVAVVHNFIAQKSHYHLVNNEQNKGERATANAAFAALKNNYDWVFMIHADDIPEEKWISDIVTVIEKETSSGLYFTVWPSYTSFQHETGAVTPGDNSGGYIVNNRTKQDAINNLTKVFTSWKISGAVFNLNCFEKIGGFDITMPQFGDTDFFSRGILTGFHDIYIRSTLTRYRQIATSVSSVSYATNRDLREMDYLVQKHKQILSKSDIKKIYRLMFSIGSRRLVKNLLHFRFRNIKSNSKYVIKAMRKII